VADTGLDSQRASPTDQIIGPSQLGGYVDHLDPGGRRRHKAVELLERGGSEGGWRLGPSFLGREVGAFEANAQDSCSSALALSGFAYATDLAQSLIGGGA
jgi:hypothetical protein